MHMYALILLPCTCAVVEIPITAVGSTTDVSSVTKVSPIHCLAQQTILLPSAYQTPQLQPTQITTSSQLQQYPGIYIPHDLKGSTHCRLY